MALADAAPPRHRTLRRRGREYPLGRSARCCSSPTTINYIDRHVLGGAQGADCTTEFGWTETDYGYIDFFFQVAYMVGMLASPAG